MLAFSLHLHLHLLLLLLLLVLSNPSIEGVKIPAKEPRLDPRAFGAWKEGRATFYGHGDGWSIDDGHCQYGEIPEPRYIAALSVWGGFGGDWHKINCGRCYEIKCNAESEYSNCREDRLNASLVVHITDKCPCNDWCCGDAAHFDLSWEAFAEIGHHDGGVIGLVFRETNCPEGDDFGIGGELVLDPMVQKTKRRDLHQEEGEEENSDTEDVQSTRAGGKQGQSGSPQSREKKSNHKDSKSEVDSGSTDRNEDAKIALSLHNAYRALHGVAPLVWNATVAEAAREWAEHLADDDCSMYHSNSEYGENLALGQPSIEQVMQDWYDERGSYDYRNPGFDSKTGHFTQMVWKDTERLGCAISTCTGAGAEARQVYVCNYEPPGNYLDEFADNVLPPDAALNTSDASGSESDQKEMKTRSVDGDSDSDSDQKSRYSAGLDGSVNKNAVGTLRCGGEVSSGAPDCGEQGYCLDQVTGEACRSDCQPGYCSCEEGACFDAEGRCNNVATYPQSNNFQATCPAETLDSTDSDNNKGQGAGKEEEKTSDSDPSAKNWSEDPSEWYDYDYDYDGYGSANPNTWDWKKLGKSAEGLEKLKDLANIGNDWKDLGKNSKFGFLKYLG